MSFGAILSGNFHQLRSSFGSKPSYKLLRFHSRLVPGKVVDARRCVVQPIAAKVEGKNKKPRSNKCSDINLNLHDVTAKSAGNVNSSKSEILAFKDVQLLNLQQIPDKKIFEWPATIMVFDIETSGFSPRYERIIEIALRDLIGGKNSTFQTLVNPGKVVTNAHVHGITANMVNRPDVPRFKQLIPILLKYVSSRQKDGKPVLWVSHNGRRFDVPFIIKEFDRCSVEIPEDWLFVDTLPLARQLSKPDGYKEHLVIDDLTRDFQFFSGSKLRSSLEALREHYAIPLTGPAHRAMQDVTTLSYVFQRITFDLKLTVPELMDKAFRATDITKPSP